MFIGWIIKGKRKKMSGLNEKRREGGEKALSEALRYFLSRSSCRSWREEAVLSKS